MLQNEQWKNAAKPGSAPSIALEKAVTCSPLYTPRFSEEDAVHSFEQWLAQGNPFTREFKSDFKASVGKQHWKQVCVWFV